MRQKLHHSLRHDCRGTTIIEFAVIAPIFFLLFFALLELGLFAFTQVALEMAVAKAGRNVSISSSLSAGDRRAAFEADVRKKTAHLINGANVVIAANVVSAGGAGGADPKPDICLLTPPSSPPTCPGGTAFVDTNGNGIYDGAGAVSLGNAGDAVELRVSLPWKVQFPFVKSLFAMKDGSGNRIEGFAAISATTVIRNEPL